MSKYRIVDTDAISQSYPVIGGAGRIGERHGAAADRERELGRLLGAAREIHDAVAAGVLSPDALDLLRQLEGQAPAARAGSGYFADGGREGALGGTFEVPERNNWPSETAGGRGMGSLGWQDFGEGSGQGSRDPRGVGRWGLLRDGGASVPSPAPFEEETLPMPEGNPDDSIEVPPPPGAAHPEWNPRAERLDKQMTAPFSPDPRDYRDNPTLAEDNYIAARLPMDARQHQPHPGKRLDVGPDTEDQVAAAFARYLMSRFGSPGLKWVPLPPPGGTRVRPSPGGGTSGPPPPVLGRLPLADEPQRAGGLGPSLTARHRFGPGAYDPRRPV